MEEAQKEAIAEKEEIHNTEIVTLNAKIALFQENPELLNAVSSPD